MVESEGKTIYPFAQVAGGNVRGDIGKKSVPITRSLIFSAMTTALGKNSALFLS
jgi:hypothetical protein